MRLCGKREDKNERILIVPLFNRSLRPSRALSQVSESLIPYPSREGDRAIIKAPSLNRKLQTASFLRTRESIPHLRGTREPFTAKLSAERTLVNPESRSIQNPERSFRRDDKF